MMANDESWVEPSPSSDDADLAQDARLVAALRNGDEAAFAALVERYHASLVRLAMLYVHDAAAAEETVQETWVGVMRGIHTFEGRSSLKTWIFRILLNRSRTRGQQAGRTTALSSLEQQAEPGDSALDHIRASKSDLPEHWASTAPSVGRSPEDALLGQEASDQIEDALEALPPNQRVVLTLRDIEGWTAEDVCSLLEISEANQRVLLHRARSRLRQVLDAYRR